MKIFRLPALEIKIMFSAVTLSHIKAEEAEKGKVDGCSERGEKHFWKMDGFRPQGLRLEP